MLGGRIVIKRGSEDEAEKPFWISFADLMTALMVLFLVVMSVALLAVTKTVTEVERAKTSRESDIDSLIDKMKEITVNFPGVTVDQERKVIDFGERARFETGSYKLTPDQAKLLRSFIPDILAVANDDLGKKWLKRVVVEGFADSRGTYLYNLNLSLQRSQMVLCALLANPLPGEIPLAPEIREQIRELFMVGGYSFNSAKSSLEASRRIEMRLEFLGIGENRPSTEGIVRGDFGNCVLGM
ncbi:OmpA/MotB family protein [Desulforegula conservatrix]|uniref:OmpA/MotB family protein n=1 Tax=Desulforegula conservatrix TaxID=153026 RepID=UPI0004031D50|nr:OmpA family protein [Desulforegula conservatrix]